MEYLDIVDEKGFPTGEVISRDIAHRDGILHRTAHVWVVRKSSSGYDILLQKRSEDKESFPGLYDTSSAGHIPSGVKPLPSALRELQEELGIIAEPESNILVTLNEILEQVKDIQIIGPAGSGKTVLAFSTYKSLLSAGEKVIPLYLKTYGYDGQFNNYLYYQINQVYVHIIKPISLLKAPLVMIWRFKL